MERTSRLFVDQRVEGPTEVADQSNARMSAPISPPAARKLSRGGDRESVIAAVEGRLFYV